VRFVVDKKLWKQNYPSIPRFLCPRCNEGRLIQKKGYEIKTWEPNWITDELDMAGLRGDVGQGQFAGFLRCDIQTCDETVVACGSYTLEIETVYPEYGNDYDVIAHYQYKFARLSPMPPIINLPDNLSDECSEQIRAAFELYFVDTGACANRLRVAVERLLDQLNIRKRGLKLYQRIDELDKVNPGHRHILDALRFVGNVASHEGDVSFGDVTDCFELLEAALEELVGNRSTNLQAMANDIINRKGKPAQR